MKTPGQKREAAFSLFEIVVAVSILGLIAGTVLSILWQAGETAYEIRELDRRDEELSIFLSLLEETIEGMPSTGSITMTPPNESASGFYELTITDAVTAFAFGEKLSGEGETVISLRPVGNSETGEMLYEIAMSRDDFGQNDEDGDGMAFNQGEDDFFQIDSEGRYWMPLISNVQIASWRFWDEDNREWLDEWTNDQAMPPLLELSYDDPYRPAPLRMVFEVPDHLVNPDSQPTSTTSGSTNPQSTSAINRTGSGGSSRGGRDGGRGDGSGGGRGDGSGDGAGGGDRGQPGGGFRGGGPGQGGGFRGGGPGQGGGFRGGGGGNTPGGGGNNTSGGGGQSNG